jgi:two-component system nitrate/nitrite response regulator NarL
MGRRSEPSDGSPAPSARSRVAVLDDHVLFGEAMGIALRMNGYDVVRPALPEAGGSLDATAAEVVRFAADVALVDLDLGQGADGVTLIRRLVPQGIAVLVLTGSTDCLRWGEALHHGAATVILKIRPLEEILGTIRRVSAGLPVLAAGDRDRLVRRWLEREREQRTLQERLARLTARERDVLAHLTLGRTVSDIAAIRTVSEATVRTQVKSILAKLEVSSQITAVGIAHQAGWGLRRR